MISYTFSEDYSGLDSQEYIRVYKSQNEIHQDYFHHPAFQKVCLAVFSTYEPIFLLSVFKDEKVIGYSAFRKTTIKLRGISYKVFVPVSYRVSEYNYPVIDIRFINEYLNIFNEVFKGENLYMPLTPGFFMRRILNSVTNTFIYSTSENPIIRNTKDEFLKASKKKGIVRDYKQLGKQFELENYNLTDGISNELLEGFFKEHIERWKSVGIDSKFTSPQFKAIYTVLSKLKIKDIGSPIINILKADGENIAMHYGFLSKKRFIYQIPVYNINFKTNKSPGSILLMKILEFNIANNNDIFDMGNGIEAYKYRFMNEIETNYNIVKFKSKASTFINKLNYK